jgi:signal peptidase I
MAKPTENEAADAATQPAKKKVRFRDTWQALVLFVVLLLFARFCLFEPFKIPSGSMEPTLIGHEDYGDRIVTNKIAYQGGRSVLSFLGGEPKRFDVIVFEHDSRWEGSPDLKSAATGGEQRASDAIAVSSIKNYIKRLVGLPGETIVISGGDLFRVEDGKEKILRKWETSAELQARLWQPVSMASFKTFELPPDADAERRLVCEQEKARAFPWQVEPAAPARFELLKEEKALTLDGPATLTYRHAVSNVYVKMGRWPFTHYGCPKANLPSLGAEKNGEEKEGEPKAPQFRDPNELSQNIRPYLPDSWEGVRCPNCRQVRFPLSREMEPEPRIVPDFAWRPADVSAPGQPKALLPDYGEATGSYGTPFFYGGNDIVGDLKLELEFETLTAGGALTVEVGSNLHRAAWSISLGGPCPSAAAEEGRHEVQAHPQVEPGRKHTLSLAYVDGSVLAVLDGQAQEPLKLDVKPEGKAFVDGKVKSVARVTLSGGAKVKLTRLDLFRDLFYTLWLDQDRLSDNPLNGNSKDRNYRTYDRAEGRYRFVIPEDCFLALGDNSPSSKDSRCWGYVPRKSLVGRASFVWWPPSRCRVIY